MTEPSHADILLAVEDNSKRLAELERAAAEMRGATKFGKWTVGVLVAVGTLAIGIVEVLKHIKY